MRTLNFRYSIIGLYKYNLGKLYEKCFHELPKLYTLQDINIYEWNEVRYTMIAKPCTFIYLFILSLKIGDFLIKIS